jgi:hypothetical protein
MPATGDRAPARMLVAVRAMAPVAGIPPNSGETMFAIPCAASSTFELCRSPVIPSATTADSMLSKRRQQRHRKRRRNQRQNVFGVKIRKRKRRQPAAEFPPNLLPIVSTGR